MMDEEKSVLRLLTEKYNELIMAVGRKYPGESRHETALRYITEAENKKLGCANGVNKDKYFEVFPLEQTGHACFADNPSGDDCCVWDEDAPDDCSIASSGITKDKCDYWAFIRTQRFYTSDEIWKWLVENGCFKDE